MEVLVLFVAIFAAAVGSSRTEKEAIDNSPGQPLTLEDFENGDQLGALQAKGPPPSPTLPPMESAELFEGDISGVAGVAAEKLVAATRGSSLVEADVRNAIRSDQLLWPGGIVPYVISAAFDEYERSTIAAAIMEFHRRSCIRFVPRSNQRDYVYILKGEGCNSMVGRSGFGAQALSLGYGCAQRGVIVHELLHAVGFWHEHSRADRDDHVNIFWGNILKGMEHNFERLSWKFVTNLGAPYDTGSIMHYDPYSFSKDGRSPTILPKRRGVSIGQRFGFSEIDLWKLNRLYSCRHSGYSTNDETAENSVNKDNVPVFQCKDRHIYCKTWARSGECYGNWAFMSAMCAKSCGACT